MHRLAAMWVAAGLMASASRAGADSLAVPIPGGDLFYVGGSLEDLAPGGRGGGGAVGWHHEFSSRLAADGGFVWSRLERTRWRYARAGAQARMGRALLYAESHLGGGRRADSGFAYHVHRGGVVVPLVPARLFVDAGVHRVDVDQTHGWLLKAGALGALTREVTAEVTLYRSAGGLGAGHNMATRLDLRRTGLGGLAGFNFGRSRPEILPAFTTPGTRSRQAFAGLRVQRAQHEVTLVASTLRVEHVSRKGVELAWAWRPHRATRP